MRNRSSLLKWTFILLLVFVWTAAPAFDQTGPAKKPITYEAYDGWRSIQGIQVSRDGTWLAYALAAQDGDGELVVRNLKTDREYRAARGNGPVITVDGKFVVFTIVPVKAELDKAKKEKKKPEEQPKNALGVMTLANGDVATVERVKSFKVPEESGAFIAYLLEPPLKKEADKKDEAKKELEKKEAEKKEPEKKEPEKKEGEKKEDAAKKKKEKKHEPGTDLIIRELATGKLVTIAEVTEYVWNKPGTWLAYAVMSKKPEEDGAFVRKAADGTTRTLLKGQGNYKGFAFDEKGSQLAFLSDRDEYKAEVSPFKLYHWTETAMNAAELVSGATSGMPKGMAVSENGSVTFSKDGDRLFFGYAAPPQAEPAEDAPEPLKVDIWSWTDPDLQPMQKANADREKKRSYQAVVHLKEKKLVPLASPDLPSITLSEDAKLALGSSSLPYRQLVSWDQGYDDYYLVNIMDGSRKKILEKSPSSMAFSLAGNYLVYFEDQDKNWYVYRTSDGKKINLTEKLGIKFAREDWDSPSDPPPFGLAGWTDGDKTVLIYDRFDIWEVKPDGTGGRMVTNGLGRKNSLVFRYQRLDRDREQKPIPVKEPILLSTTDDKTKASGFYRVTLASSADPAKVIMLDKLFGGLIKAKNAETYLFTLQRFEEFPNLWTSGPNFADMKKLSDANPQQSDYVWGKAELIDYMNVDGKILDAILIKPENFDPSKKYPLMVYIYEKLAGGLHRYVPPSPGTGINYTRYISNGYIILQPDIVYDVGYPGPSAMKCVLPAIEKVVGMGFIDPKRIGIQGHSWGGYQISYMITQTDIFAAVEAGASVVNMTSAYGGIRWGTGMSRAFQYEKTQSRIGAPLWSRALQFIENSPLFWVEKVKTPYLTIHNDEDDAVPWYQGIEFFSALRRLGKEAYMFNFNTEKHGLRQRENQKYWTVHLDEFFDHYLLGKPRPEWMVKGVPYLERGKRDVNSLYKKDEKKEAKK
jgi:dipeptidyl aminopeptidase/acylaminoacyl peptidase